MSCNENLLMEYGAVFQQYKSDTVIFSKGNAAQYYYQIIKGTVEYINYHEDGKIFSHRILSDGQSIGEALLFINKGYPVTAIAKTDCIVAELPKQKFLDLLHNNAELTFKLMGCLAEKLY